MLCLLKWEEGGLKASALKGSALKSGRGLPIQVCRFVRHAFAVIVCPKTDRPETTGRRL
jgi:hypothetical protein